MGVRDGEFCGVDPGTFLNAAARFFLKLKHISRKSVLPGYKPDAKEEAFSFAGTARWKEYLDWDNEACQGKFLYKEAPMGVPLSQEIWESSGCTWTREVLAPPLASVLRETPVKKSNISKGFLYSEHLAWQKQLLKLIGAMRYCIIPLSISYLNTDDKWYEWFGGTGCINSTSFRWWSMKKLKIKLPDLLNKGGIEFKIGVCARNLTPEYPSPVEGTFWKTDDEYTISIAPDAYGSSELRIYGAADLSRHPEFKEYFDSDTEQ